MKTLKNILPLMAFLFIINIVCAVNDMPIIAAFQGEHHRSAFGYSMVSLDFNHDGYKDLVVASSFFGYNYLQNTPSRGKVYVYYGGPEFNSNTPPSLTLEGTYNGTSGRKIGSVYCVGDVNGGGFEELCVTSVDPSYIEDRYINIYFGNSTDWNTGLCNNLANWVTGIKNLSHTFIVLLLSYYCPQTGE